MTLTATDAFGQFHSGDESISGASWSLVAGEFINHFGFWHNVSGFGSLPDGLLRVTINVTHLAVAPAASIEARLSFDDDEAISPYLSSNGSSFISITAEGTYVMTEQPSDHAWVADGYIEINCQNGLTGDEIDYTITKIEWVIGATAAEIYPDEIPPSSPPVADFSADVTSGAAPLTVTFTDLSTNTPTSWAWDFGDSSTSTDQNPIKIYATPGTYTVALTATNADGSDTETKVDYITVFGAPVADFSGTPTSGNVALSVAFTDASTNAPTSWFWDFGDGGSSTSQNPTYVYNYIGTYTVTLTATNSAGSDSETKVAYITVTAVTEYGASVIENCDIDTGGLSVGLRISDVAIARDNRLGSVVIDASAELRVKDNSYSTLTLNGTLTSLAGDRSVWDVANFPAAHASDIDAATFTYHNNPAIAPATAFVSTAINLTLNNTYHHVKVTAAVTITLPTAASISGHEYIIKATVDSVLVNTTSSQTIDGDLTKTLNTNDCLIVFSDGANWLIG